MNKDLEKELLDQAEVQEENIKEPEKKTKKEDEDKVRYDESGLDERISEILEFYSNSLIQS